MGLLRSLLLLPIKSPMDGALWVTQRIVETAETEVGDPATLRRSPLSADVDLDTIARDSHGYVGADLVALAREAALAALDRAVTEAGGEDRLQAEDLFITPADLRHGLSVTAPSALRDAQVDSLAVTFADIGGLDAAKAALTEAVIWPQKHRATFAALNLRSVSGGLLSGPAGSSKTLLARALAFESSMNFIPEHPTRMLSQFLAAHCRWQAMSYWRIWRLRPREHHWPRWPG